MKMMTKLWNSSRQFFLTVLVAGVGLLPLTASSTNLNLSNLPLYLGGVVEPNVMFTLDDSGSMYWSFMPDGIFGNYSTHRAKASEYNKVYYNPWITYTPPVDPFGVSLGNASFGSAWNDGYDKGNTCQKNLSNNFRPSWYYGNNCDNWDDWVEYSGPSEPAYYYVYYTNHPNGPQAKPANCSASLNDDDCYIKVQVSSTSGADRNGDGVRSLAEMDERTNFANWYSYYRRRIYLAKTAIGQAFANQGTGMRVAFGAINNTGLNVDGVNTDTVTRGVRDFKGADRTQFFNLLYGEQATGSTPLRRAVDDVGQYFSRTDDKGPWNDTPGQSGGQEQVCRQSYHIIMSDGYWNSTAASTAAARANTDGTDGPTIGTWKYVAKSPFSDTFSNTLADVAMYYWKNDLHTGLANKVPTNPEDPAFWQHLVTYTVGLGVEGTISPAAAFAAIKSGAAINWPDPTNGDPEKIDDMLHAAVNGRGGFFSAKDPSAFASALSKILKNIIDRNSSASSVALNSGSLFGGSYLFQAKFNTGNWDGEVLAFQIQQDGSVAKVPSWNAANQIPAANSRRIATFDGSKGIPFRWSDITAGQKADIGKSEILDYLRGDRSKESPAGPYRKRASVLGDIINSAPLYVGPPGAGYPDFIEAKPYSGFALSKANRDGVVVVGANDGMVHVFDATKGVELYAYVPSMVIPGLDQLSVPGYVHRYYVDGSPVALDAYINSQWRTVLVGGLNAGGQGIYALDITDVPSNATTESAVASKVMWEFSDKDDADLGFTYSRPNIVKLANGKWAAVFGNGYNNTAPDGNASTTGDAVLYIVDLETGSLIRKIDTQVGSAADPTGANRPNGLSTVAPVDIDGDYIVDYVYGGDIFGNLWKFDLTDGSAVNWKVAFTSAGKPAPLFRARADASKPATAQPITVRPVVGRHETGKGFMVYFGTGKYLEVGDNSANGQTTQTFYAIWDQNNGANGPGTVLDRDDLTKHSILKEVSTNGFDYRLTDDKQPVWDNPHQSGISANTTVGWYLDLFDTDMGNNTANHGERQVSDPLLRGGRIIFTTMIPSSDPCSFGGDGWLMELDAGSGKRLPFSPFDTDHDGVFTAQDMIKVNFDINGDGKIDSNDTVPATGIKSKGGILPSPAVISDQPNKREFKYGSTSSGSIEITPENPGPGDAGRKSWLELTDF